MPASIRCLHMNHLNAVVDSFDDSVAHFREVYGAQLISDMPREEWHACLITTGQVIFELFAPHDDLLHARFGPHYIGVEYQTPDVAEARRAVTSRGMRVIRELGVAFHLHPADAFGVALEFYDQSFHAEPPPTTFIEPIRPLSYWRDEHSLGCTGLKRYSVAVADLDAATSFFTDFTDATVLYKEDRPAVQARAVGLGLGDTVAELLGPTGEGPIQRHVDRYGDGIRSTVLAVDDLANATSHFAKHGIELVPGDAADTLAIRPSDNCGLMFEFSE